MRRLAKLLGARQVLTALAAALEIEPDLRFACALVQALNLILLTAPEACQQLNTYLIRICLRDTGSAGS